MLCCRAPSRAALRGGARAASSLTKVDGRFSAVLWGSLRYPMEKMRKHPFVVSVRDGSIDVGTMRWYLEQDFLYLVHYGRAFKILSARVPVENAARHLTSCAEALSPTRLGKEAASAFAIAGLKYEDVMQAEQAPYTRLYTDHLLATACLDPYPSAMASLMPCPMTYQRLFSEPEPDGSPPPVMQSEPATESAKLCKAWVKHYGSKGYRAYVSKWEKIIDEVAEQASAAEQDAMLKEFDLATRMEYMFWEMAEHRLEDWGPYTKYD